jgi:hypothetical protein
MASHSRRGRCSYCGIFAQSKNCGASQRNSRCYRTALKQHSFLGNGSETNEKKAVHSSYRQNPSKLTSLPWLRHTPSLLKGQNGWDGMGWINLAQDRDFETSGSIKFCEILEKLRNWLSFMELVNNLNT